MATEVSSWARILAGYNEEEGEGKGKGERNLVYDFVGGCGGGAVGVGSRDLDVDSQVPPACSEKRLDLLSDRMRLQKSSPTPARRGLQDLNLPPASDAATSGGATLPPEDSIALDLKLVSPAALEEGHRACTLEKVRTALERVERESRGKPPPRRMDGYLSSSSSSVAAGTSPIKRWESEEGGREEGVDGPDSSGGSLMAAGCLRCLFYVMVAKRDPRCPRCGSHVPVPEIYNKKPRVHV